MDCKELVPGRPKSFEDAVRRAVTYCQQMGNVPRAITLPAPAI